MSLDITWQYVRQPDGIQIQVILLDNYRESPFRQATTKSQAEPLLPFLQCSRRAA